MVSGSNCLPLRHGHRGTISTIKYTLNFLLRVHFRQENIHTLEDPHNEISIKLFIINFFWIQNIIWSGHSYHCTKENSGNWGMR